MRDVDPSWTVADLASIIDALPTAILIVDQSGHISHLNMQAERLFGYTRAELRGEMVDVLLPYRFRAGHGALRSSFVKAPSARPMGAGRDLFGLHKNGTEVPIEIGLSPFRTEHGGFVVSAIIDISERKRLEARVRATVESAPTAMVMIDQTGTIVLVNRELERLFGYDQEELLRKKVEVLIPEKFRGGHTSLRTQYFAAPDARRMGAGRELFGLRKDRSEFPIEIGLNPVTTDEGPFVLAAIVDITERRKQADAALRQANEALERSNIELQRFAYVASHDLQTPMRSIASFADLLRTTYADKLDAQAEDWMHRIVESVKQLQGLVRELLDYSRIDAEPRPFTKVPLRDVVNDAVSLLDVSIRESSADLTCAELPVVSGDRSQLVQLMLNLIGNALKYRGVQPPRIDITARSAGAGDPWIVAVRDNGLGIALQHHERIFDIFERLHSQADVPGTGIGLAVCRRVVSRHGGRIWVESEPGGGSTFLFTIAAAEESGA